VSRRFRRPLTIGAALALIAFALCPAAAAAYTYGDTLTVIWRPLPNLPAFARPGDSFTVWANAPSSATGWSASLKLGALTYPLTLASGGWQSALSRWEFAFQVPANVPEEVYDLSVSSDQTGADLSRHAVKVLPAYRSDFYFAQISDTHLPSHPFSDSNPSFSINDTTGMADFDAVIEDLNAIHPEFIIHTGDLVNEGELEEYLGAYEMGRAQAMLSRLRDPIFVSTGNHDIGGWQNSPPPDGYSRYNWWRYYGWPFLGNPPDGHHSQDYSFDYGLLHCVGLEAYINNGSYDHYMTNIYGAQSFTPEQMTWLANDLAAVPVGHAKLLYYHYDFGGTMANGQPGAQFTQINPAALGIDGAIFGHWHTIKEDTLTRRTAHPFNLGLQSVIDYRAFRIFRVHNNSITPGPMHHSGGIASTPTDSLSFAWSGPNNGTRASLSVTVNNRYGETWDQARLVFVLADHDSTYAVTGGTLDQVIRQGGFASVYVDCVLPASGVTTVTVTPLAPTGVGGPPAPSALEMSAPYPNPFQPSGDPLGVHFALPVSGAVRIEVLDVSGRRVATPYSGSPPAGDHLILWNGRGDDGRLVGSGLYMVRIITPAGTRQRRVTVLR
jgi:3',5'-cyclic AMP phosphodiesterase CpdA